MTDTNTKEKIANYFLNAMQKIRLKIPYRYREIVKTQNYFT